MINHQVNNMKNSSASDAINTLITLAQAGEIDPWDVQVIDVIDRFLQELGITQNADNIYQQAHLPKSGQVFLWASMLVRFKADTLEKLDEDEISEEENIESSDIIDEAHKLSRITDWEKRLRRRSAAPPPRHRKVTLQELITHIEEIAEELETTTPQRRRRHTPRPQSHREATEIVTQLAHQENLTEMAAQLETFFQETWKEKQTPPILNLDALLKQWHQVQPLQGKEGKQDRVGIFWALLLLSSQSKVELSQEEFYQDLKIQVL